MSHSGDIGSCVNPGVRGSPAQASTPSHALRLTVKRRRSRVPDADCAHPGNVGSAVPRRSRAAGARGPASPRGNEGMGEIGSRHGSRRAATLTGVCLAALASGSARAADTATPIKHLIVVFQENIAFDHYFGTYPNALNRPGEPAFHAAPGTPPVSGLTAALLTHNPNKADPRRLG